MKHFNEENCISHPNPLDWQPMLRCSANTNNIVSNWAHMLSFIIEKHAPLRERRVCDRLDPWLTPGLRQLIRAKDKLKISAVKTKSDTLLQAYRKVRNQVNKLNIKLKQSFYSEKTRSPEGNIMEMWKTIKQVINKSSKNNKRVTVKLSWILLESQIL